MSKTVDPIAWTIKKHNLAFLMTINELTLEVIIKEHSSKVLI